jgi:hypothetical protein
MLRIGDPPGLLPAACTFEAAMATVLDQPHRPPQLIASRRNPKQDAACERTACLICGGTQQVARDWTLTEPITERGGYASTGLGGLTR